MGRTLILFLALLATAPAWAGNLVSGQKWPATYNPTIWSSGTLNSAVVRISGAVNDARIGPVKIIGAYRAVDTDSGAVVRRLVIDGLVATKINRDGVRLREAYDTVIQNFEFRFRDLPQIGTQLPEGIAIYKGSNITIRKGIISGFRMVTVPGVYTNGDGIATEGGVSGVTIQDVTSSYNSDAGFDLKGKVSVDRLTAIGNSRAFRFWHNVEAGTIKADRWTSAAVWVGKGATVHIKLLRATNRGSQPVIILEDYATLKIDQCELDVPYAKSFSRADGSGTKVSYGPGCRL
jgi:hypothetical protein